jgi:hypothetical protein
MPFAYSLHSIQCGDMAQRHISTTTRPKRGNIMLLQLTAASMENNPSPQCPASPSTADTAGPAAGAGGC